MKKVTSESEPSLREYLSPEERALPLEHTIDPGFVNRRRVQTVLGESGMGIIDEKVRSLPHNLPEPLQVLRIDHVYTDVLLAYCEIRGISTLAEILSTGYGQMFCSTEQVLAYHDVYESKQVVSEIEPAGDSSYRVKLEYSTKHIHSDTLRMELSRGDTLCMIATFKRKEGDCLVFRPLLMGGPWIRSQDPAWADKVEWGSYDFFQNFVEGL